MAKVNIQGFEFEGTSDEIVDLIAKLSVKFPKGEVMEEVCVECPQEEPLKVGDYVWLTTNDYNTRVKIGEIVEIITEDTDGVPFELKNLSGEGMGWAPEEHLIRATAGEVAQAKADAGEQQRKQAEADKWSKIGRKPGEFKVGDIVLYGRDEYVRVTKVTKFDVYYYNKARKDDGFYDKNSSAPTSYFKLITPVEARFDR